MHGFISYYFQFRKLKQKKFCDHSLIEYKAVIEEEEENLSYKRGGLEKI